MTFGRIKMKEVRNKTIVTLIAFLLMSTSVLIIAPEINAAPTKQTYAFLSVTPNPVGLGQSLDITMWLDYFPPTAQGSYGDRWENFTISIIKPDKSTQTLGPYISDPVGTAYISYTPDQLGNYTFQFSWPGQILRAGINPNPSGVSMVGYYFAGSTSPKVSVTVQQEQISPSPGNPLPTDYWNRPIYGENREWASIGGNWLMRGYDGNQLNFNPYTTAPNTAHIVWTKPIAFGGIVGGGSDLAYYSSLSYEEMLYNPIIINGRLYYNNPCIPRYGFYCVDLRTGQDVWFKNGTGNYVGTPMGSGVVSYPGITCGMLLDMETPNQHGVIPYLWSLAWGPEYQLYDAFTGNWILTVKNAPQSSATVSLGGQSAYNLVGTPTLSKDSPNGGLMIYIMDGSKHYLALWNATKALPMWGAIGSDAWRFRPVPGSSINWTDGLQWNVTIPVTPAAQSITEIDSNTIIATATLRAADPECFSVSGFDAKTGAPLWNMNISANTGNGGFGPIQNGIFTFFKQETMQTYGYDARTGKQLWVSDPKENAWGMYTRSAAGAGPVNPNAAYGMIYSNGYDGYLYCYNGTTGKTAWTYYSGNPGLDTPYGEYPFYGASTIADDKVYLSNNEHSPNDPMWRGARLQCVNATTGEGIWSISAWMPGAIVADGYLLGCNYYDSQIYCFGKGQTATTVEAPMTAITAGSKMVIHGTVTDQSPASLAVDPKGTACVSDQSQTQWMEYLYEQKQIPSNATGVPIAINAIDPNGNLISLGTTASDTNGFYTLEVDTSKLDAGQGTYRVIATFQGSESYFASNAESSFVLTEPSATTAPTLVPTTASETYFIPAIAGLFALIIIVAIILALLMLRKKP
jgi:outer membrane protein assembly factor BamB